VSSEPILDTIYVARHVEYGSDAGVAVAALSLVITLAFSKMALRDRVKPVSKAPGFVRA
jgi:hypothetical protein